MIKAIKIDSVNRTVTEIEIKDTLQDFYKHIGCSCMETVRVPWFEGTDVILVDEEGLLHADRKEFFRIDEWPHPIAGNGVIVGYDEEGETIDYQTDITLVRHGILWLKKLNGPQK